jgi:thiol-disulfide isomerase/thioredoxin
MRKYYLFSSLLILTSLILSACGTPSPTPQVMMDKPTEAMMEKPTEAMMEKPTDTMMEKPTTAPDTMMQETATPEAMMDKPAETMMETPAWFSASLTDAGTGKTFTINELKGKVVLVETMAQWCSNCMKQQIQVKALHEMLGVRDDLVSIGLDIDPNENAADLKNYVARNGFNWLYAVSPADVSREIAKLYGDQFLNPPSTPILIIDRNGVAHPLQYGFKSAEDLFKAIDPYLKEGM